MGDDRVTGCLEILNGDFEGMRYDLSSDETLIGRNPTTDITLLDEGISREHALLLFDEDAPGYVIEDLASTNGTKLNGKRIRSAPLAEGDQIGAREPSLAEGQQQRGPPGAFATVRLTATLAKRGRRRLRCRPWHAARPRLPARA